MEKNGIGNIEFDENFMAEAVREAIKAGKQDEVPVGCVIVNDGKIIGRGYNRVESLNDPTAHAEILAITAAAEYLNSWRINGSTIYSTIEPCIMCAGAIILSRAERLVYGASDPKFGACGSLYNIVTDPRLNHNLAVSEGILRDQCAKIMIDFFRKKRRDEN